MGDVKRYGSRYVDRDDECPQMIEVYDGEYVKHADYATLEAEVATLRDRLYCNCPEPYLGVQIIGSPVRCERCRKEVGEQGTTLRQQLQTVLKREAEAQRRHDEKLEAMEQRLAEARKEALLEAKGIADNYEAPRFMPEEFRDAKKGTALVIADEIAVALAAKPAQEGESCCGTFGYYPNAKAVHGVTNLKGPLVLKHGPECVECQKVAENVRRIQSKKQPAQEGK